jgi:hypothetical protein
MKQIEIWEKETVEIENGEYTKGDKTKKKKKSS